MAHREPYPAAAIQRSADTSFGAGSPARRYAGPSRRVKIRIAHNVFNSGSEERLLRDWNSIRQLQMSGIERHAYDGINSHFVQFVDFLLG